MPGRRARVRSVTGAAPTQPDGGIAAGNPRGDAIENRAVGSRVRAAQTWWLLFLSGLLIRVAFIPFAGTHDVTYDLRWGHDINREGFLHFYYGNYFPFQYHVFQIVDIASRLPHISGVAAFNTVNVIFEVATFFVLQRLLSAYGASRGTAFHYWLNPYFLCISWLGYIDGQFGFFVVLALLVMAAKTDAVGYTVAGMAWAAALFFKPQPLVLAVVFSMFVLFRLLRNRRSRRSVGPPLVQIALLFAPTLVLISAYSGAVAAEGRGWMFVPRSFVHFGDFQVSSLTANMLNVWQPVAHLLHTGTEPIYAVQGPHWLQHVGVGATAAIVIGTTFIGATRCRSASDSVTVLTLFTCAALTLPMMMTRAHENHLFLGALLGVVCVGVLRDRILTASFFCLLALQFVHIVVLYGLGTDLTPDPWPSIRHAYDAGPRDVLAVASVFAYVLCMWRLGRQLWRGEVHSSDQVRATATI